MLTDEELSKLRNRVRRVAGQVEAIERMLAEGSYCVDILMQISAAVGALRKIGGTVLENHLRTCVQEALASDDESEREKKIKIKELIEVFQRYAR